MILRLATANENLFLGRPQLMDHARILIGVDMINRLTTTQENSVWAIGQLPVESHR